jgi:hypothetical protein
VKLFEIAHARSGDKGDICNISVIVHEHVNYAFINKHLTAERVRIHFANLVFGPVERFELDGLGALNFVLHDSLDGGVNRSLALDAHGKCFASVLLEIDLPVG